MQAVILRQQVYMSYHKALAYVLYVQWQKGSIRIRENILELSLVV